jgi:hypothetical protein
MRYYQQVLAGFAQAFNGNQTSRTQLDPRRAKKATPTVFQTDRETTQNPAIREDKASVGTGIRYGQLMPKEFPTPFNPLSMAPMNGEHFTTLFAKNLIDPARLFSNSHLLANPQNILAALSEPQEMVTGGSTDVWAGHRQLTNSMRKRYDPMILR